MRWKLRAKMRNKEGPRMVAAIQRAEGNETMKHYSTINRVLTVIAALIILGDIALGLVIWRREDAARKIAWENSYPMANQHVVWEGAGYQPIVIPEE